MSEAINGLKPESFWRCFSEIAGIPRPSGHEERIAAFIMERAQKLGLTVVQDVAGNVLVKKPATKGREAFPSVCLQSHLDMVCEKNADKVHDFLKDPIELVRKGDVIMANGTTLGADNGAGVATSLAIMEDDSLEHGPLEFLFTLEEETGLTGANNLSPELVSSRILLNLDSEEEGELYVGCAGGKDTLGKWQASWEDAPSESSAFLLTVKGLKGGHSGLEIDKELGNAIKILNRALLRLSGLGARLARIDGGNMRNAIPRECTALLFLPASGWQDAQDLVSALNATFKAELASVDPGLVLSLMKTDAATGSKVLSWEIQQKVSRTISSLPTGVQHMSVDIPGLVETSTNVSVITTSEKEIVLVTSQRSSVASRLEEVAETVQTVFELGGAGVEGSQGYPGWKPNLDSSILKLARKCYKQLYGKEIEVKAIHAGLECGIIGERIPGMDMISFGPTMAQVHSPDERLYIDSVGKYWDFVREILRNVQ